MGLYTTHEAYGGSCTMFNRWRYWLAEQIGIDLNEYEGYGAAGIKDLSTITHDLMPLFNHSDCDGELTPAECRRIANGLKQVVELNTTEGGYLLIKGSGLLMQLTMQFRKGCIMAANANETMYFG